MIFPLAEIRLCHFISWDFWEKTNPPSVPASLHGRSGLKTTLPRLS